jgi:oligopeptide/dipeptide ABC transporter ATP-binding protein
LLKVDHLAVGFPQYDAADVASWAMAVQDVSFTLQAGRVFGLVGESGCGKSLTSLALLGLIPPPGRLVSGEILFEGQDLLALSPAAMRRIRGARIALIPQDPLTSLNPVYTIGNQLTEVLQLHQGLSMAQARLRAIELLEAVRIPNARERLAAYPHQFSGGMRQRVMIAMALSCSPALLIADEPTTALDVTVQAQILDLMRDIQAEHQTAILLITHDLGVVAEICDDVAVMYAGRIVEQAAVETLFTQPQHPYTQGLFASLPKMGQRQRLLPIAGQPPNSRERLPGCAFAPRCPQRQPTCVAAVPLLLALAPEGAPPHGVRCILHAT